MAGIEGRRAERAALARGALEALGVAGGEDDGGAECCPNEGHSGGGRMPTTPPVRTSGWCS